MPISRMALFNEQIRTIKSKFKNSCSMHGQDGQKSETCPYVHMLSSTMCTYATLYLLKMIITLDWSYLLAMQNRNETKHNFDCPVIVLKNDLKGGIMISKWSICSKLDANLDPSPFHRPIAPTVTRMT